MMIRSYLRLFRVFETSMVVSTLVLALLMLEIKYKVYYTSTLISLWLLGAGISCWNDALDIKSDAVSHPDRPIVSGKISVQTAKLIGTVILVIGLSIIFLINLKMLVLALLIVSIGVSYSCTSKRRILLKNTVVAFSGILALIGLLWVFNIAMTIFYTGFLISIACLLFSYEILKDIQDIEGDKRAGIQTLANKFSPQFAALTSITLFVLSCMIMSINFAYFHLYMESLLSLVTSVLIIIPGKKLYRLPNPRNSENARYSIIIIIFSSLSVVSFLQMQRINYYILF